MDSQVLSQVMLSVLDERWKDHLYDLDQLRNAIQYRAWGQKDPLVEYKREAFEMFEDLMHDIQSTFTERFLKIQVSAEPPRPAPPPPRRIAAPPAPEPRRRRGRPVLQPVRRRRRAGRPDRRGPAPALNSSLGPGRAGRTASGARGGPERSLPLRVGQEVQEMPRGGAVRGAGA